MDQRTRRRVACLWAVLAAGAGVPAGAALNTYEINGTFGSNEHGCTQITLLFGGSDCTYGRNRAGASGTWIGPLFTGAHYVPGGIRDVISYVPTSGVFDAGTGTFALAAEDGKLAAPITGTFTIDDNGTPGNPADDLISAGFTIGALARNIATGASTRAVQRWTSMDHVMAATPVNATATVANGAGGVDYVIGSRGFPAPLCSATDNADCLSTSNASAVFTDFDTNDVAVSFWAQIAVGGLGIERTGLMGDPAFVLVQPPPNPPTGNVGATSTATFTGYSCDDSQANDLDCTSNALVWQSNGPGTGGEPAGFDNLVMKISTNATGEITSGFVYWTEEYFINFGGPPAGYDNSWQGGTFSFTGSGGTPAGPVAVDDQYTVPRNSPGSSLNVMQNDQGFAGSVTVAITAAPQHGTAIVTGSPGDPALIRVNYTPDADYSGADTFQYSASDGVDSDVAAVAITVVAPQAVDDTAEVKNGTAVAIPVLANDSGFANPVTVAVLTPPSHGSATVLNSPGNASAVRISYTPAAGYSGPDSLVYQVTDGVNTASATVSISVLTFKARDDSYVVLSSSGSEYFYVVTNDIGFRNPVTLTITQFPTVGSAHVDNSPGQQDSVLIHYFPNSSGSPAEYTDTIRYQVSDGFNTDTATVTIRVVPYAALDDAAVTGVGQAVTVLVQANDLGFGSPATLGIFTNPQHGTVSVIPPPPYDYYGQGSITYRPNPGFLGTDTFEYAVDDGTRIDTALVTISVFVDDDADLVDDTMDNCLGAANTSQRDTDGDGYGNWCDGDLNNDGRTNFADLASFRLKFGTSDPNGDLDGSGVVNFADLARFKALFGAAPGPSAIGP